MNDLCVPLPPVRTGELIDTGANLTHDTFAADLGLVLQRARRAGITQQLITGVDLPSTQQGIALARQHPGSLFATAGIHPHNSNAVPNDWITQLKALLAQPEVRALGEAGLDFYRNFSPPEVQEQVFEAQLELAAQGQLPLFLHCRDSGARFFSLLHAWRDKIHGVLHCFTGDEAELKQALDAGLYIGITGWICDERRGAALQRLVRQIPAERIVIETDAPYLMPRTIRPQPKHQRNEPALLPWVLHTLALCRGCDAEQLAWQTSANARLLFNLP